MNDDDQKNLNTQTQEPEDDQAQDVVEETNESNEPVSQELEETAKSSDSEATGEVENAPEDGTSEESNSQQTRSEAQDTLSEPENSEPSDASTTDEPAPETNDAPKNDVPGARWYVVHTYSGHENKVATTLRQRIESERLEDKIVDVLVPVQDKIEIKGGKKATVKEKIFPGYILVKMLLDDNTWLAVRTIQGVTSFVGIGNKPTPISDKEVETIVKFTQEEAPIYKQVFSADDTVKIVDGPFAEFIGKVDSVDEERGKVKVLVSIFGRETPVELDFLQVQKI